MYFLKDSIGNTIRAIQVSQDKIIFIKREDTQRIECCTDLQFYKINQIPFQILDEVSSEYFHNHHIKKISMPQGHLTLVKSNENILKNIDLQKDDTTKFKDILIKTSLVASITAITLISFSLIYKKKIIEDEKLEVVQVMTRDQIEKLIVTPKQEKSIPALKTPQVVQKSRSTKSMGLLEALGSLNKSKQVGGLKLEQIESSRGVGRGGLGGSGGVQTTKYARGIFSAPLGNGSNHKGAGGYGTKGKGGGQAGYGKIQLVGQGGDSYFQPIENEAFVGGGLDRNEIAAVIQRHISEVRFCYEKGLQQKPNLAGRLSIQFLIGPKGLVTLSQVAHSSLGQASVDNCIRDKLKTWSFPQPEGGVTVKVTYPFILRRLSDS